MSDHELYVYINPDEIQMNIEMTLSICTNVIIFYILFSTFCIFYNFEVCIKFQSSVLLLLMHGLSHHTLSYYIKFKVKGHISMTINQ